jgi:chorismate mutase
MSTFGLDARRFDATRFRLTDAFRYTARMERPIETLNAHRQEIDALDRELVALLNRRATLVCAIARLKHEIDLPIRIPEREAEVLRNVRTANLGPLDASAVERVFETIIAESRRLERMTLGAADGA